MPEIAKMLGVELGEKFKLRAVDQECCEQGLSYFAENGCLMWISSHDEERETNGELFNILSGYYEIIKLPWEPKKREVYFYPNAYRGVVECYEWENTTFDFAMKALGMIYHTREKAEAHFAEDYEKLTGKKLEG